MVFPTAIEQYISVDLPSYESERYFITAMAIAIIIFFVVVLPVVIASSSFVNKDKDGHPELPGFVLPILNMTCLLCLLALLLTSSNNLATSRLAYVAPLLTAEECQSIIDRAHKAAALNAENYPHDESFQKEPKGWQKERHSFYPTTDLNLIIDPFTKEDREYLADKLNKRFGPLVERIYGIKRSAIRANDMFVVRYDATKGQPALRQHTDSSHVSFNILLNNDFEGGGTRFHHRHLETYADAHLTPGDVLISNANILHEGLATTNGTRYIFVGFTAIETFDPFTERDNELSLFASWLSLTWMQVRFKQGFENRGLRVSSDSNDEGNEASNTWMDSVYFHALFKDIWVYFTIFQDIFAPHGIVNLVQEPANRNKFIAALDADTSYTGKKAIWFKGQQVTSDVNGQIVSVWEDRVRNQDKFEDL